MVDIGEDEAHFAELVFGTFLIYRVILPVVAVSSLVLPPVGGWFVIIPASNDIGIAVAVDIGDEPVINADATGDPLIGPVHRFAMVEEDGYIAVSK